MSEIPDSPAAVGNVLTKKVGPLPGFAWVLIIVAVAYGVYWYKNRGAGSGPATGDPALAGDNPGSVGFSSAGPVTSGDGSVQTTYPVGRPATTTNAQWASLAGNALIASGKYDPSTVQNALSKYLSGGTLSAAEQAIINIAVRDYQLPPEGVLPVKSAPVTAVPLLHPTPVTAAPKPAPKPAAPKPAAPKPAPKPAAPTFSWYTVRAGDSLSLIAQRYWGNAGLWTRIYADNRATVGPNANLIHPGQKLKIASKP